VSIFETARLTAGEIAEADLDDVVAVHLSNPAYLELTEGSAGEPGRYDRGMLERDLALAGMTPGRHAAALRLRATGECTGVLDWMDENPSDGCPWLGLVMVHADHQRLGLATEAVGGLAAHGRRSGWARLREGVLEENTGGLALARRLGMREIDRRPHKIAAGERTLVVFELRL
jgi:RimJ/RimL family protein N-acetyltransferase